MRVIARAMRAGLAATLATGILGACMSSPNELADLTPVERSFVRAAITWDFDHDGVITCEEWRQYAAQLFAEADKGKKGYLTADEYRSLSGSDRLFSSIEAGYFDADHDGRISRAEFVDRPNPAFRVLDRDKDCRLTNAELPAAYNPDNATRAKKAGDAGHPSRRNGI